MDSSGTATVTVTPVATGSTRWTCVEVLVHTQWKGVNGDSTRDFVTWISDRTAGSPLAGIPTLP
jgi:hypothetical protein